MIVFNAIYIEFVEKHFNKNLSTTDLRNNFLCGFFEEVGEVFGVLKKHLYHGHDLNKEKLIEEIGDVFWYYTAVYGIIDGEGIGTYKKLLPIKDAEMVKQVMIFIYNDIHKAHIVIHNLVSIAAFYEIDYKDIINYNVAKLQKRYPNGFNNNDSINRCV